MKNKFTLASCTGLMAMGIAASANADTINVNFQGSGNSIDYVFTTSSGSTTFDSATFNVNDAITSYDSSNFTLQLGNISEVSTFEVFDGATLINQMVFDGFVGFTGLQDELLEMLYYGDGNSYAAANYSFSSPIDSPMLYISGGPAPFDDIQMTNVSVSTISAVPVPAAAWLFATGLVGLIGISRKPSKKKIKVRVN